MHQTGNREIIESQWSLQAMFAIVRAVNQIYSLQSAPRTAHYVRTGEEGSHDKVIEAQLSGGLSQDSSSPLQKESA